MYKEVEKLCQWVKPELESDILVFEYTKARLAPVYVNFSGFNWFEADVKMK